MNDKQPSRIHVECYAGHRADEEPRRFKIDECEVVIEAVVDRWLDPGHRHFRVRGGDGGIYLLRHDTGDNSWELTMYDSGRRNETRPSSN